VIVQVKGNARFPLNCTYHGCRLLDHVFPTYSAGAVGKTESGGIDSDVTTSGHPVSS
jgi:hypothetical protein